MGSSSVPGLSRASPCCPSRPRAAARPGSALHLQDMKPTYLLDRRHLLSESRHWPHAVKRKALGLLVVCESRRQFSKSFTCGGSQRTSMQLSTPLHSQDTLRYGNMFGLRQSAEMLHRSCRNPPQAQTSENTCCWDKPRRSSRASAANSTSPASECCSAEG